MPCCCRTAALLLFAAASQAARMTLHKAADKGDLPPLKVAIEGYRNEYEDVWVKPDLNAQTKKGDVALHLAVCNVQSDIEAVRVLLEKGADANVKDGKGRTPLHIVGTLCAHKDSYYSDDFKRRAVSVAKLLLKHGASLAEGSTDAQLTPLHAAAASGHFKLLEYLLGRKGASVGALDSAGATPLHHAARSASEKGVLALLQWGADPKVADAEGKTARDVVAGTDSFSVRVRDAMDNAAKIHAEAVEAREKKRAEKAAAKEKEAGKAEL